MKILKQQLANKLEIAQSSYNVVQKTLSQISSFIKNPASGSGSQVDNSSYSSISADQGNTTASDESSVLFGQNQANEDDWDESSK